MINIYIYIYIYDKDIYIYMYINICIYIYVYIYICVTQLIAYSLYSHFSLSFIVFICRSMKTLQQTGNFLYD